MKMADYNIQNPAVYPSSFEIIIDKPAGDLLREEKAIIAEQGTRSTTYHIVVGEGGRHRLSRSTDHTSNTGRRRGAGRCQTSSFCIITASAAHHFPADRHTLPRGCLHFVLDEKRSVLDFLDADSRLQPLCAARRGMAQVTPLPLWYILTDRSLLNHATPPLLSPEAVAHSLSCLDLNT